MHDEVFKDRSRNSATIEMELFATIGTIFHFSHHYMGPILTLNINMKNKQAFNERQTRFLL